MSHFLLFITINAFGRKKFHQNCKSVATALNICHLKPSPKDRNANGVDQQSVLINFTSPPAHQPSRQGTPTGHCSTPQCSSPDAIIVPSACPVVRLLSACCPVVVRFESGQQPDNKRTTSGQQGNQSTLVPLPEVTIGQRHERRTPSPPTTAGERQGRLWGKANLLPPSHHGVTPDRRGCKQQLF